MSDTPKFQWSKMYGEGEQVVVRADDYNEWVRNIGFAKALAGGKPMAPSAPKQEPTPDNPDSWEEETEEPVMCKVHNVVMPKKISQKTGDEFYSHGRKIGNGWDNCYGKGYKSDMLPKG